MSLPRYSLGAALAAAALLSKPAAAQIGDVFCFPGPFNACASVWITSVTSEAATVDIPYARTTFDIAIKNLEGQAGEPASGAFRLWGIVLGNLQGCIGGSYLGFTPDHCEAYDRIFATPMGGATQVDAGGNVVCTGAACAPARWDPWDMAPNVAGVGSSEAPNAGGIIGCSVPYAELWDQSTCAGFVDLRVSVWGELDAKNVTLDVRGMWRTPTESALMECRIGDNCVSVTPEPASLLLMASGLAAAGAVRRRQRRRARAETN